MSKQIIFTFENNKYTLEYDRESVRETENSGFRISEADDKPLTTVMTLIEGAFLKHHATLSTDEIYRIYSHLPNKSKLIGALTEMYTDTIRTLQGEPEDEGKAEWEMNW
jgi:hypothetical protein